MRNPTNRIVDNSFVSQKTSFLSTLAMAALAAIAFFSWDALQGEAEAHGEDINNESGAIQAVKGRPDAKKSNIDMTLARVVVNPGGVKFKAPEPGSYQLAKVDDGVDGIVYDVYGNKTRLLDVIGDKIGLVSFIYTQCGDEDGCPVAVSTFYEVEELINQDPEMKANVKMVTMSFDPVNDTPDVMADFANVHASDDVDHSLHFHNLERKFGTDEAKAMAALYGDQSICRVARTQNTGGWEVQTGTVDQTWTFVTAKSEAELTPVLDGFAQYIIKDIDAEGELIGTFSHVLKVYLIDKNHDVRNIYSTSFLYPELVVSDLKTLLMEERQTALNKTNTMNVK